MAFSLKRVGFLLVSCIVLSVALVSISAALESLSSNSSTQKCEREIAKMINLYGHSINYLISGESSHDNIVKLSDTADSFEGVFLEFTGLGYDTESFNLRTSFLCVHGKDSFVSFDNKYLNQFVQYSENSGLVVNALN